MAARLITKQHVKTWVVNNSKVTNPYKKKWWYASVTIGYDYSGKGGTIEKAYDSLTESIYRSPFVMCKLSDIESFRQIVKA